MTCSGCSSHDAAALYSVLAGEECFQSLKQAILQDAQALALQAGGQLMQRVQEYLQCQFAMSPEAAQAQVSSAWQGCVFTFVTGWLSGKDRATLVTEAVMCLIQSLLGDVTSPGSPGTPGESGPNFRPVARC